MKESYQSLIASAILLIIGLLMIFIGHIRGTYYSVVIFSYISFLFFILSFLTFLTFLYSIFHKEYKVKKHQDLDPILDDTYKKFADKDED
jgi:uncharacterized protein YacL